MDARLTRLKIIYGIALAVIASCMLSASWIMQHSIGSNTDESRVINLSGRQRMLSQRLTKAVLALPHESTEVALSLRSKEIQTSFAAWTKAHQGLQSGDADLGLPVPQLSAENQRLFANIQPHFEAMVSAIGELTHSLPHSDTSTIERTGKLLLAHEQDFLRGMDAITFQFDKEAHEKLARLQQIEHLTLSIGLLILLFEFLFIFRPSLRRIQKLVSDLQGAHRKQSEANAQLAELLEQSTQLASQADAAAKAKSAFLSAMNHELRTPLNGIMGMTEVLCMTELTDEQREFANTIKDCSNDLLKLVDNLLTYSKINMLAADRLSIEFPLRRVLYRVIEGHRIRAAAKGVTLLTVIESSVPDILHGDPDKLCRVMAQLADNAVKFTEEGQIVVGADVAAISDQEITVRFSVTDTGIGIDRDTLPTIFDPFAKARDHLHHHHAGAGVGLASCKRLVEMMGSQLEVTSALGKGTTFTFELRFSVRSLLAAAHPSLHPQP